MRLLTARGLEVRILTRDITRASHLQSDLVEIVRGDVLDSDAIKQAVTGTETVISAIHGFNDTGVYNPSTVDRQGNSNLIQAALAGSVQHFILVSMQGAAARHPMELARMKYLAEQQLRASGLSWTIIQPSAYMETWGKLIGEPLLRTGKTPIFGRGHNPINFVSAHD